MTTDIRRFGYIDSLRAIAILGVIAVHTASKTLVGDLDRVWQVIRQICIFGGFGVPLFYAVSAFTIVMLYNKRYKNENHYIASFYTRRLMRIAPVYWGGILLYTAIFGFTGGRGWQEAPEAWHYLLHATFLNMTTPMTASTVVPGGWSISNEVMFYIIFPALFLCVRNLKGAVLFMGATIALSPVFLSIAEWLVATVFSEAPAKYSEQFLYRWLPNHLTSFAAGFVAYYALADREAIRAFITKRKVAATLIAGAYLGLIGAFFLLGDRFPAALKNQKFALLLVPTFVAFGIYQWRTLDNALFHFIGRISFSCYILHFLAITTFDALVPADLSAPVRFIAVGSLTLVATFTAAALAYRYWEQTFVKLTPAAVTAVRRVLSRDRNATQAA